MKVKEIVTTAFGTEFAFVLYPFVIYPRVPDLRWRRHEWVHVEAVRRSMELHGTVGGWLRFYWRVIDEVLIKRIPHEDRSFEKWAHASENDMRRPWIDEYENCIELDIFRGLNR